MSNDLISREALKEEVVKLCERINANNGITVPTLAFTRIIDNAPTVELVSPTIEVNISEETKQKLIEELQKPHKLLVLPEPEVTFERSQGELVEKLNERIEESVCKYCQMNKHCELCEISRVFSIIDLTNEEKKGGAGNG